MNRRVLSILVFMVMGFCCLVSAAADDEIVSVESDEWTGTVFGDVGGTDKLTAENFEISEIDDAAFTMRSSNNRGKIASSSEGITFLYQAVSGDDDFEAYAYAAVESFDVNNQVSFGFMLRDKIYDFVSTKEDLGSYLAVGPISVKNEVANFVFLRTPESTTSKQGELTDTPLPTAGGMEYDIFFAKTGNTYTLTFGNEEPYELELPEGFFASDELYIGLFTARNTTVTFSDVTLDIF